MAKLQTKKINVNDFSPDARQDIAKIARSLNPFFDDVERAFRKGLSVEDNLPFQYITVTLEVDANGKPKQQVSTSFNLTNLKGCVIINAKAADTTVFPTATPFASFNTSGSVFTVTNVAGLPADKSFTLTLLLMA
jgi:hypothetical protein